MPVELPPDESLVECPVDGGLRFVLPRRAFGPLTGRDVPELEWMATLLRHAIRGETADAASDVTR